MLRGASRERGLEPMMTVSSQTHYGANSDIGVHLSAYAALLQGMKGISYYRYGPKSGANVLDYWSDSESRVKVVHDINYDISRVEDDLYHGSVRPSEIAIVFPQSDDIWNYLGIPDGQDPPDGDDNWPCASHAFFMERRALYFALRHAGYPVDILSEKDIKNNRLEDWGYRVVYLSASHLDSQAAAYLKDWVANGGILFSTVGGGLLNQYNQPEDYQDDYFLLPVYGIDDDTRLADLDPVKTCELYEGRAIILFSTLNRDEYTKSDQNPNGTEFQPLDTIQFYGQTGLSSLPVHGYMQHIDPNSPNFTATPLGEYVAAGSPAFLENSYEYGKAYLLGATPGIAYVKSGYTIVEKDPKRVTINIKGTYTGNTNCAPYNPSLFKESVREIVTYPLRTENLPDLQQDDPIEKHVWFEDGEGNTIPLVEGSLIENLHRGKILVPIVNFNVRPLENMTIHINVLSSMVEDIVSLRNKDFVQSNAWYADKSIVKITGYSFDYKDMRDEVYELTDILIIALKDIVPVSREETIQSGIDGAADGQVVLVEPGTYVENLVIDGKSITVVSKEGPQKTVINGNRTGSVVNFKNGADSVLEGFRIVNGSGDALSHHGGGIYCESSSPSITNCNIYHNEVDGDGGGIYCDASSPVVEHCKIRLNEALGNGGGIYCGNFSSPEIIECFLPWNSADNGGGIYAIDSTPWILGCRIGRNSADTTGIGHGGGIYIGKSPGAVIDGAVIEETYVELNQASFGAGIALSSLEDCAPTIMNCIIWRNQTPDQPQGYNGGGIHCDESSPTILHTTLLENYANMCGGGIYCDFDSHVAVENSILWGDTTDLQGPELCIMGSSDVTVTYSDVQGGQSGAFVEFGSELSWMTGNIDEDPQFFPPPDYGHLTVYSPCIDRIETSSVLHDIDGEERPFDYQDPYGWCCFDMGADELVE